MNIQVIGISDVLGTLGFKLSFSPFYHPLKLVNNLNKHRYSMRSTPAIDELQLSSYCAITQENTVGVIGGVSVLSTLIFLEKLVWSTTRNGGQSVPFIVCSDPIFVNPSCSRFDQKTVVDTLKHKRMFLEQGGARCIVMPCHLSHVWFDEIVRGCMIPFLHVGECVAVELKESGFKPLEVGSRVKIGIIANDDAVIAEVYQKKLEEQDFEVILPDRATMDHIITPAVKSLQRKDKEGARNLLRIAIQLLLVRAVNTVIIASDEFQGLLPRDDPLCRKCIDPMDSLVRSTVEWVKSVKLRQVNINGT